MNRLMLYHLNRLMLFWLVLGGAFWLAAVESGDHMLKDVQFGKTELTAYRPIIGNEPRIRSPSVLILIPDGPWHVGQ
jgi:hypothetical protein